MADGFKSNTFEITLENAITFDQIECVVSFQWLYYLLVKKWKRSAEGFKSIASLNSPLSKIQNSNGVKKR
jgi:hypothetical protein